MTTQQTQATPRSPLETELIAIRVGRCAELNQQMMLLLLRSMQRHRYRLALRMVEALRKRSSCASSARRLMGRLDSLARRR